jgi:hypothetical protein
MECLKCGHRIPDKSDKCLYCGAWTGGEVPPDPGTEPSQHVTSPEKTADHFPGISPTKEERKYQKLEDLPESLRAKVEDILKKGERGSQNAEIEAKISNFPELMDRTGARRKKMSFLSALRFLLKKE